MEEINSITGENELKNSDTSKIQNNNEIHTTGDSISLSVSSPLSHDKDVSKIEQPLSLFLREHAITLSQSQEYQQQQNLLQQKLSFSEKNKQQQHNNNFIVIVLQGIHSNNNESVEENKIAFKKTLRTVRKYWFWEFPINCHIEFLNWTSVFLSHHKELLQKCTNLGNDYKFEKKEINNNDQSESNNDLHRFLRTDIANALFILTPKEYNYMRKTLITMLNTTVHQLKIKDPERYEHAKIILIGDAFGSILLHHILVRVNTTTPIDHKELNEKDDEENSSSLSLRFAVHSFFLLGSPLGAALSIQGESLRLPKQVRTYNIFHAQDCLASRLESLFYPTLDTLPPPVILPFWRTNRNYKRSSTSQNVFISKSSRSQNDDARRGGRLLATTHYMQELSHNALSSIRQIFGSNVNDVSPPLVANNNTATTTTIRNGEVHQIDSLLAMPTSDDENRYHHHHHHEKNETLPGQQQYSSIQQHSNKEVALVHLVLCANKRYGVHDRKPKGPMIHKHSHHKSISLISSYLDHNNMIKPTTFTKLCEVLNIYGEQQRLQLLSQIETKGVIRSDLVQEAIKTDVTLDPRISPEEIDILSESETGAGLELPVRLDFRIQESLSTLPNSSVTTMSSFPNPYPQVNYWKSHDFALFFLKQINLFRPRVTYAELLCAIEFSEAEQNKVVSDYTASNSSSNKDFSAHNKNINYIVEEEENEIYLPPKRVNTLKPPPRRQSASNNTTTLDNEECLVSEVNQQVPIIV